MMKSLFLQRGAFYCSLLFLLSNAACTVKSAIEQARPTRFLSFPERLDKPSDTPFDLSWTAPNMGLWLYSKLVVEAVRTDFVDQTDWIYSAGTLIPTRASYLDRLTELADYSQDTIAEEFNDYTEKTMELTVEKGLPFVMRPQAVPILMTPWYPDHPVEAISPKTRVLSLQISISEANFSDPFVYGGLLAVPVPAIANLSSAVKSPSMTIEVKFIDRSTDEVIWEIVDKRFPQLKIIDINRLTVASALREMVDSFAEDLVQSFYRKADEKVSRRSPFSLLPW